MSTKHRRRPSTPRPYCAGHHGGACVLLGTAHTVYEIMGQFRAPTLADARQLVRNHTAGQNPARVELVAQHIAQTGEAVWHAVAEVFGQRCACAPCVDTTDAQHTWSVDSIKRHAEALDL